MNYAQKILSYLCEPGRFSQVFLAAGAPPVEKVGPELRIIINTVLTPEDIRDTLLSFAGYTARPIAGDPGRQGAFAFGLPNQGRFKINYLTQRGSPFISVQRLPFDAPKLEALLTQPSHMELVNEVLSLSAGGIVVFTATTPDILTQLLYAVLSYVNDTQTRMIYILEQQLSYLLKHRNSIVIQAEVGTDVANLAEGIQNGLLLSPYLMYVSNPKTVDDFSGLISAAQAGVIVLASMIAIDEPHLLGDLEKRMQEDFSVLCHYLRKTISVSVGPAGQVSLTE